jgi:hypothetical protein
MKRNTGLRNAAHSASTPAHALCGTTTPAATPACPENGDVMRLLNNVQALSAARRMRGIGQAAVQRRIGQQQMTEFVGDDQDGDGRQRNEVSAARCTAIKRPPPAMACAASGQWSRLAAILFIQAKLVASGRFREVQILTDAAPDSRQRRSGFRPASSANRQPIRCVNLARFKGQPRASAP